ncbi:MAG: VTT domain-containing protein [Ignavibacteriae bacterium]|nr:VTT domain-containing protein [Ignavibacteriota bacterium]
MALTDIQRKRVQSLFGILLLAAVLVLFLDSGLYDEMSIENLRALGSNPWTPALIIIAMTGAWAYSLPASVFFFITPLLFSPLMATAVICIGSAGGTTLGYVAARYVGGPWVERFKDHRLTKFIERHATFPSLFAVRIMPGSWHGPLNYGAGLVKIPFLKFLIATLIAISIKGYLYAVAISNSVNATSVLDALNWQTVTATMSLAALGIAGHLWQRKWKLQRVDKQER